MTESNVNPQAPQADRDSVAASPDSQLTTKDRSEIAYQLAERAWNRYESRRRVEWRTAFGVWTAFGGGAGIILTARSWAPDDIDLWGGAIVALLVVGGFACYWLPYIKNTHYRDMHTSYFWETWLHVLLESRPPAALRVENQQEGWPTAYSHYRGFAAPDDPQSGQAPMDGPKPISSWGRFTRRLHAVQWMQFWVTLFLATLFWAALWSKYRSAHRQSDAASGMRIEGDSLEIESATNLKLRGRGP